MRNSSRTLVTLAAGAGLALGIPAAAAAAPFYPNCDAARAAGVAPIHRGEPGYRIGLDRDRDGIACEATGGSGNGTAPAGSADTGGTGTRLAETGPEVPAGTTALLGAGLLAAGAGAMVFTRRQVLGRHRR